MRYSVYAAGVILLFLVALGVGATAAAIVGWQLDRTGDANTGPAGKSRGTTVETTSTSDGLKAAGLKPSASQNDRADAAAEKVFIHRATDNNSRGDYTYIEDPAIDGDPQAIVLASVSTGRNGNGPASYAHNIGVWYAPMANEWAIFNQDQTAVPLGSTFKVTVPANSASFVHRANASNSARNYTYLNDRLTNGRPDAKLQVTQNWNPGGGRGVYNDHPVGVIYDSKLDQWAIYNLDGAPLPQGAAFNVAVSEGAN